MAKRPIDPRFYTDTYEAVSRLLRRQATVRPNRVPLTPNQRERLAEALDISSARRLNAQLVETIEYAIGAYRWKFAEDRIYANFKAKQAPVYIARIDAARALWTLLGFNDRELARMLEQSIASWQRMADLVGPNAPHRPGIESHVLDLCLAVAGALDRVGIPLEAARGGSNTRLMEALQVVRQWADLAAGRRPVAGRNMYPIAKKTINAHMRSRKQTADEDTSVNA